MKSPMTLYFNENLELEFNFLALRKFFETKGHFFKKSSTKLTDSIVFSTVPAIDENWYLLPASAEMETPSQNSFHIDYNDFDGAFSLIDFIGEALEKKKRDNIQLELTRVLEKTLENFESHAFLEKNITKIKEFIDNKAEFDLRENEVESYLSFVLSRLVSTEEQQKITLNLKENNNWGLDSIKFPLLVVSAESVSLYYNSLFLDLDILPIDCSSFISGATISIGENVFKIYRYKSEKTGAMAYLFYSGEKEKDEKFEHSELGIISGSIAHELNNPVAGILAGASLLEVDYTSGEINDELKEIKEGALRCKELIDIFLGLSKIKPQVKRRSSLKNAFNRALNLLSFRMVEINTCCEFKFKGDNGKKSDYNVPVMTMIFYLILNEVLTMFSRKKLVDANLTSLSGEMSYDNDNIIIIVSAKLPGMEKIRESKLIRHLLSLVDLSIEIENQVFKIRGVKGE